MIAGQKIALGRIHAGRTIRRTTTDPVRRVKAQRPSQPRKAAHVS